MIVKKHFGAVSSTGELILEDAVSYRQDLLNNKDKQVYLTVNKKVNHRSINQNSYAHGVIFTMMGDAIGCTADEAKESLKWEFLRKRLPSGIMTVRSTSDLSTVEFEDFCENCRRLAAEMFNCVIPLPGECEY